MRRLILIAHNLRSCHNVGSLLRTAEGLGVCKVYLTGYTPYPQLSQDERLPHIARKITAQIHKTALDAETLVSWEYRSDIFQLLAELKDSGVQIIGLEQAPGSVPLPEFQPTADIALIVGREVEGIEPDVIAQCDNCVEIPMFGRKESFNVVQAAAMALYQLRFHAGSGL